MNEEIPFFEDKDYPAIEGVKTVERDNVNVIVLNPEGDKVLCLEWNEFDWKTLVIGGVDGLDLITASKKEVEEETGYSDLDFVCEVGKTRAIYYAGHKKENRLANATGMLFRLNSMKQNEVNAEELKKHSYHWIDVGMVDNFINIESQKYLWNKAKECL